MSKDRVLQVSELLQKPSSNYPTKRSHFASIIHDCNSEKKRLKRVARACDCIYVYVRTFTTTWCLRVEEGVEGKWAVLGCQRVEGSSLAAEREFFLWISLSAK